MPRISTALSDDDEGDFTKQCVIAGLFTDHAGGDTAGGFCITTAWAERLAVACTESKFRGSFDESVFAVSTLEYAVISVLELPDLTL